MSATTGTPGWPRAYPPTRRGDHVDVYKSAARGEVRVPDPYSWLEENSPETEAWVEEQEAFTRRYLDENPERQELEDEIRANMDYAKFGPPAYKNDGRWYWYFNSGLQAQWVLHRSAGDKIPDVKNESGAGGEVFFDPNLLSSDGTASLGVASFSPCAMYFAYGVSRSGSDSVTIYVRPTSAPFAAGSHDDGRLPDEVRFVKFSSITWDLKCEGFFYQRYPTKESHGDASEDKAGTETELDLNAMLCYHKLGTPQSEDIVVLKDEEHPTWFWSADIADVDRRYLEVYISPDTSKKNRLWICDLETNEIGPNMKWIKLIDEFDSSYSVFGHDGTKLYIQTNKDAPQYKIITMDLADESRTQTELIPEDKNARLQKAMSFGKDKFAVVYKRNVKDEVYIHALPSGDRVTRLAEDFVGKISVSGKCGVDTLFVTMTGFTTPGIVASYDESREEKWQEWRRTKVGGLRADEFSAEQVWYESKDGTKVPMFIVSHKNTKHDGTAAAIQYGYGGFGISIDPFFSPAVLTVVRKYGLVLAVPNIRGGGEFGEDWHEAAIKERKVNSYDDFIAATEYIVKHKYAGPGRVVINGGSNGGLLVSACVNRASEGTFGGAVADVGVHDLLKFAQFTIGYAWTSDYGDPKDPAEFDFIYPISPLHNVPADKILPPTMLTTADHDDRVVPLHSFKLAATLQHLKADNPHPLLLRIEKKAGHGAGKATEQQIKESADKWGFVAQTLGLVKKT